MSRLMIGISGVRGVVGENLTPELLVNLGQAFGTWTESGKVVVGRDTRVSGDMVKHAVFSGLLSAGCRIVDVGVCGTPSAAMMVSKVKADGGIVISASHNPIEWNALKFFRSDGVYLNQEQGRQLLDIYYGGDAVKVAYDKLYAVETDNGAVDNHLYKVLDLVDIPALRKRKFRVALDCCNGAGSVLACRFLDEVGCETAKIYCDMNGLFERNPEPTRANVTKLLDIVRQHRADVGFAQDADADRIALISEKAEYIGDEYSLCLAAKYRLSQLKGQVVTNLSTTRMIDDVAAEYGCKVLRTPVGEVNVAETMLDIGAVVGGEGNGGVIDPRIHYGRDALTGMAMMLQLMLETGKTMSELAAEIPTYQMVKLKTTVSKRSISKVLKRINEEKADNVDNRDGVKLDFSDGWVHVRASNTEPIVRVYAEARTSERANQLANHYMELVEQLSGDK
ncbi:MAG: phosphoglucosamine mutase [Planctomycetota bacterium]|jgi:phosphomannomutase|nr:phosphoglucosamine mutase [Planctomycetota bacterium]